MQDRVINCRSYIEIMSLGSKEINLIDVVSTIIRQNL